MLIYNIPVSQVNTVLTCNGGLLLDSLSHETKISRISAFMFQGSDFLLNSNVALGNTIQIAVKASCMKHFEHHYLGFLKDQGSTSTTSLVCL